MVCVFCEEAGGEVLWEDDFCRVIWAYEADYPGLCRVIWDQHVKEMSDLDASGRNQIMRVVLAVEEALVKVVAPEKVNLASLGNQVPHLHWHVIPRFKNDPHYPFAIWGRKVREGGHPLVANFALDMRRELDHLLSAKRGFGKI
ncbi:MAG: HIT family protein [Betaproteobacteria bacterium]